MTVLRDYYTNTVVSELKGEWNKQNAYEVPRLEKIVVNVGMGKAHDDKNFRAMVVENLAIITGQRPVINKAKKSIAGFRLREGMEIGASVTLRTARMEEFYSRLVNVVLPRVRDFRGLSERAFDGHGNYSLGLRDHTVFPEIPIDDVTDMHPLQITIVTSSGNDEEARELLRRLGFPFSDAAGTARIHALATTGQSDLAKESK